MRSRTLNERRHRYIPPEGWCGDGRHLRAPGNRFDHDICGHAGGLPPPGRSHIIRRVDARGAASQVVARNSVAHPYRRGVLSCDRHRRSRPQREDSQPQLGRCHPFGLARIGWKRGVALRQERLVERHSGDHAHAAPHRPVRVSELSARLRAAAGRIDPDAPDRRRRGPFRVARDRILFFLAPKAFGCRLMSAVHSNWGQ